MSLLTVFAVPLRKSVSSSFGELHTPVVVPLLTIGAGNPWCSLLYPQTELGHFCLAGDKIDHHNIYESTYDATLTINCRGFLIYLFCDASCSSSLASAFVTVAVIYFHHNLFACTIISICTKYLQVRSTTQ